MPATPASSEFTQLPLAASYIIERKGEKGTAAIVNYVYGIAARWTVHAKIDIWGILAYFNL